jgi:hypothetical protein
LAIFDFPREYAAVHGRHEHWFHPSPRFRFAAREGPRAGALQLHDLA